MPDDWRQTYADVLSRLRGRVDNPSGTDAWCPACEADGAPHRSRSLSVSPGRSGNLLLKCHSPSACPVDRILGALGLDLASGCLLPPGQRRPAPGEQRPREFVRAYDYRDRLRRLLFQVVRWKDRETGEKTFSQRRPNPAFDPLRPPGPGNPKYLRGLGDVRPVLYRLPELCDALEEQPGRWVFAVEGEKAVDYLRSRGLVATCNPMGAGPGKWRDDFSRCLRGRNVAVVADDDPVCERLGYEPGPAHAAGVALSLYGVAARVKLLRMSGDRAKAGLDDWMARRPGRGGVRELWEALEAAPDFAPAPAASPALARAQAALHRLGGPAAGAAEWLGRVRLWYARLEAALASARCGEAPGALGDQAKGWAREAAAELAAAALAGPGEAEPLVPLCQEVYTVATTAPAAGGDVAKAGGGPQR